MRKTIFLFLVFFLSSCNLQTNKQKETEQSRINETLSDMLNNFSIYFEFTNKDSVLNNFFICCWQTNNTNWESLVFFNESSDWEFNNFVYLQENFPCPLNVMSEILNKYYDITDPNLFLLEIPNNLREKGKFEYRFSKNEYLYNSLNLKAAYIYATERKEGF